MSATSFLRHRRATALNYVSAALTKHKDQVTEVLAEYDLTPADLAGLAGNNDVLSIADKLAAMQLDEDELDTLEELNTLTTGDRAAVHSSDVRDDQFEDKLQHSAQETVGVGNMHDGREAAEDLANVSDQHRIDAGGLAAAAAEKAADQDDALANHGDLPNAAPTSAPAADAQVTAEDGEPSDPEGANPGADTVVDLEQAAADLAQQEKQEDRLEKLGEAALAQMSREDLLAYADRNRLVLEGVGPRTAPATIAKKIVALQGGE